MSVQEPRQFTPAQVLEAGRRAEGEGRTEFALQFYRHLVASYPGSGEAAAAESALARLTAQPAAPPPPGRRPPPPPPQAQPVAPLDPPRLDAGPAGASLANPFDPPRGPEPSFAPRQGYAPPPQPAPTAQAYEDYQIDIELPHPTRDYRTGRVLARLLTWLGGFEALIGLMLLPVAVLSPRSLAALPVIGPWIAGPAIGMWLIAAGLAQVLAGQIVRAVLEHANAARDLAAVARAEAEARYGEPGRKKRR